MSLGYRAPDCSNPPAKWCHLCNIAPRDCYRFDPDQLFYVTNVGCHSWNDDQGRGRTHDCIDFVAWKVYACESSALIRFDPCEGTYRGWTGRPNSGTDMEWMQAVLDWLRTHPLTAIARMGVKGIEGEWQLLNTYARRHREYRPLPIAADQLEMAL